MAELTLDNAVSRFKENEDRINKFVNAPGGAVEYETSEGAKVPALPVLLPGVTAQAGRAESAATRAEISAAGAYASGNQYGNTSDGLDSTRGGQYFLIRTADSQVFDIYLNNSGVAVKQPGVLSIASAGEVNSVRNFVNVTFETPLGSGFYTLYSAVRAVPTLHRRKGLVISFEVSAGVWETLQFRGADAEIVTWVNLNNWYYFNRTSVYGVERFNIPSQYWQQGLRVIREAGAETIVEDYIGPTTAVYSVFVNDTNWVRIALHEDFALGNNERLKMQGEIDSLSNSLLQDATTISFVNQGHNNATGVVSPGVNSKRLTHLYLLSMRHIEEVSVATDWSYMLTEFDSAKAVIAYTSAWTSKKTTFNANTRYIRLTLRRISGGTDVDITGADIPASGLKILTRLKSNYEETRRRERLGKDYLKTAVVVSDWKNETIAHCSTIVEDLTDSSGTLWAGHYASPDATVETISSNIFCTLLKLNTCDPTYVERFVALKKGDVVGGWKQSTYHAPYDPALIINSTNIQYLMVGNNVNDSTGVRFCQRVFNKATSTFANEIQTLKIKYTHNSVEYTEDMNMGNLNTMVDRLHNRTGANLGEYPIFSGRIDKANGYYWVYLGSLQTTGTGFQGCIIKSVDGIVWEYVSAPPLSYLNVWEGALKVLGQKVYVFIKADNRYRIYHYSLDTGVWFEGPQLTGQVLSRPFLWHYMGKLYAIYNSPNNITSWGEVYRSSVAFSIVDQSTLEIIDTQVMKTEAGCHYFSACDYRGTPYFMYTEDRKKANINQVKGNISITPMWFLNV